MSVARSASKDEAAKSSERLDSGVASSDGIATPLLTSASASSAMSNCTRRRVGSESTPPSIPSWNSRTESDAALVAVPSVMPPILKVIVSQAMPQR